MRKDKALTVMFFASLVSENEGVLAYYNDMKWTPGRLLGWFTETLPIKVSIFQLACLCLLLVSRNKIKGTAAPPMIRAIVVSFLAVVFAVIYGLARDGLGKPMYTQAVSWVFGLVFALTAIAVFQTVEDFERLNTAIVYAALWRSCMALLYFLKVRNRWWDLPSYMTTHEDTVVFVLGFLILASRAIELRTKRALRRLLYATPLILLAIQVNNRRLAWASLLFGILVVYFMLPAKSKVTRKLNRSLLIAMPFLVIYVTVGWGSSAKIFAPLQSFSSMGGGKIDLSTKARDNENLGLVTMIQESPMLGTGLGHEWLELDSRYTVPVAVFPMYHYSPHNSIFALFAFCGVVGFAGLWMILPVAGYLHARTYRNSPDPALRSVASVGLVVLFVYANQAYGDMGAMGVTHMVPATIMGASLASAARLSVLSGAWPLPRKMRRQKSDSRQSRV